MTRAIPLAPWQGVKVKHSNISRPEKFIARDGRLTFVEWPKRRDPKVGLIVLVIDTPQGPVKVTLDGAQCCELAKHLMEAVMR